MSRMTSVTVDVYIDDFDDDDLIEELESRGYKIFNESNLGETDYLDKYECEEILSAIGNNVKIGSPLYNAVEKIRSIRYG